MNERKTIVVSGVNLRKGGTLTIMRSCLEYLSGKTGEYRIVALVHRRELFDSPGIDYIELPWCVRSWALRLWAEYVTMHRISRQISREDGRKVWLWLSMHDTTPRVIAEHQEVYCHTSFPFMKWQLRDFRMDFKIPLFSMFTRWAYRINVHRNDCLIVQQNWFRDAMSGMLGVPVEKFRVIPPQQPSLERYMNSGTGEVCDRRLFLYASTPDCHKNFETLCEAARLLELETGPGAFRVLLTISGTENRYARWLKSKWGGVSSIDFHGFMTRDELFAAYRRAGTLVFPSRVETWGLPISEYLAVNTDGLVLAADLPYAHETSPDAVFFPATDAVALKNEMLRILESETTD
ncbi:MAG: glycosyltransferase family 4 protein [Bacteroidaceae bacterium]|nr:glycosyltransferase family 4 protein [Bacteroidaceae bacterium]